MFPAAGVTKADIVEYYRRAGGFILPHLKNRPLTLKLYPDGVEGKHLYLKNAPSHTPDWVKTFSIERKDKSRGTSHINYVLINDLASLLWAANLSSLEMHTFLAKAPRIDRPLSVVFDLDPGPPANILQCIEVALEIRSLLDGLGLQSFVKASGSKGLQLYVPLNTAISYAETEPFARAIAENLEQQHPRLIVSQMAKALRSGKVLIDWSQNVDYKTTICVYSMRAKSDRPYISLPFGWDELRRALKRRDTKPLYYEPAEALRRMEKLGDLFGPVLTLKQKLPKDAISRLRGGRGVTIGRKDTADSDGQAPARSQRPGPTQPLSRSAALAKLPQQKATFIQPMQPELVRTLPSGAGWRYELKWDGYRAIAVKDGDDVTLYSRNRTNLTSKYPAAVQQLRRLKCDAAVIDGEIVALDKQGRPSFQALQNYSPKHGAQLVFVAFDLLNLDGRLLLSLNLTERQELLEKVAKPAELRLSESLGSDADAVIEGVRALGLEGVVAKHSGSKYEPGVRGRSWFKYRIGLAQEFVVGGYTRGDPFNSLLVGYYEGRKLVYAGKVKAGYTPHSRKSIFAELQRLLTANCPFVNLPESKGGRWGEGLTREEMAKCVWVKPKLVAQVSFVEWTSNSHLRHATFLGLRKDKRAASIVREEGRDGS